MNALRPPEVDANPPPPIGFCHEEVRGAIVRVGHECRAKTHNCLGQQCVAATCLVLRESVWPHHLVQCYCAVSVCGGGGDVVVNALCHNPSGSPSNS